MKNIVLCFLKALGWTLAVFIVAVIMNFVIDYTADFFGGRHVLTIGVLLIIFIYTFIDLKNNSKKE